MTARIDRTSGYYEQRLETLTREERVAYLNAELQKIVQHAYVNAPAIAQRAIAHLLDESVDIKIYQRKRDLLCDGLKACGFQFKKPGGAFYLFPKTPIEDDVEFVRALQQENILTVPGSGFGGPGHIRIAYCVDDSTIEKSLPGFERVMKKYI